MEIQLAKGMLPTLRTPAIACANNSRDARRNTSSRRDFNSSRAVARAEHQGLDINSRMNYSNSRADSSTREI